MSNVNEMPEEKNEENYMEKLIREDVEGGVYSRAVCTRFPRSRTGIFISAARLRFIPTMTWPADSMEYLICALMIPTR